MNTCEHGKRLPQTYKYRKQIGGALSATFVLGSGLFVIPCGAQNTASQTEPSQAQPAIKPPPVPTGVVPLPQGPPPTGLQAPLPTPAMPVPTARNPLRTSPLLDQINHYVSSRPITIEDAVAIALSTNRTFATAAEALYRAQGRTGEARAALNPNFNLGANLNVYDAPTKASFPSAPGTTPTSITLVPQFNPVMTATISLPLDIMGALHSAASQAQFQEVAARIDVNRARNQIVYDVKNAFYNVLRAQAQVGVATDTVNNALAILNNAQKNYAAGTSPRFDVITATTNVANAQQGLIQAQSQVSLSLALLKSTIGLDIKTPLRITDTGAVQTPPGVAPPAEPAPSGASNPMGNAAAPPQPLQTPPPMPAPNLTPQQATPQGAAGKTLYQTSVNTSLVQDPINLGPEFDTALQEALRTRPEILEAEAGITAAQHGIQFARRSSLPSLALSVGYTYTPNAPAGFARVNVGSATLAVSVPVFDGGLARARVQEARADVATAETNRRQAVDQVSVEVQQAYLALLQARDRVAVANVGLTQAREAARLAQVRYNAGVAQQPGVSPILELSTAQTSLTQAESNQVNALYDYNDARAQLDRAIGRYK